METKYKKYFFRNYLNKALVNKYQIMYIHIIEDNHNEISLESFNEKDLEKISKRFSRFVRTQMDRSSLIVINLANNNLKEKLVEEEMFVNRLIFDKLKSSQVKDHG
jgi:hypothetical protein